MRPDLQFILDAAVSEERVVFLVDGVVWEGHVVRCLGGVLTAAARPIGERAFSEVQWALDGITDMARAEPEGEDEGDDELVIRARAMAEEARAVRELSLAERLVRDRLAKEKADGHS